MSTQVQYRRGTATENNAFTGALAEITVDTTNWTLRIHNGTTAGGAANIATVSYVNAQLAALSANAITFGTSNVQIPSSGGNIRINVSGTSNVAVFDTAGANIAGILGVTGNITGGNLSGTGITGTLLTAAQTNITSVGTLGALSVTGNVSGGNLNVTGNIVDTGPLSIITGSNGNIALAPNGTGIVTSSSALSVNGNVTCSFIIGNGSQLTGLPAGYTNANLASLGSNVISTSGNITGGNLSVGTGTVTVNNIVNSGANGVGNIGSSTTYFNTVFAKATSAQYADLAEMYQGDESYMPGTVVEFGGKNEVTVTTTESSTRIAGVVSTNPSYLMNSGLTNLNAVPVALTGRVPCQVLGPVKKGDRLVSSMLQGVAQAYDATTYQPGCIIGKSLEDWEESSVKLIEVVVGRL